jgi:hypothetical protein
MPLQTLPDVFVRHFAPIIAGASLVSGSGFAGAESFNAADLDFFEQKIRPVLVEKCYKCHSTRANKSKGGLLVDSREALLKGGDTGAAIHPGSDASLILKALNHAEVDLEMPPDEKLSDAVIADFTKWVQAGAAYPVSAVVEKPAAEKPAWWETVKDLLPADRKIAEAVDHYVGERLKRAEVTPAPQAADHALVRRITLDLVGRIPSADEVRAYVSDPSPGKKEALIERLMNSPGFVRHQVNEFEWTLMDGQGKGFRDYLTRALGEKRGWDQVLRETVVADPTNPATKGSEAFLRERVKDLDKVASDFSSRFFGVNISCAQCHDHPLVPSWKQDHYYGLKAFFGRTFEHGDSIGERAYGEVSFKTVAGESKQAKPMFLTGAVLDEAGVKEPTEAEKKEEKKRLDEAKSKKQPAPAPAYSRRAKLAELALAPGQESFFARAIVNQLWQRLFGTGLVMPVDQMHGQNPPSHPELLQWLARDFAQNGYDIRRTMRGLLQSEAYARSSRWSDSQRPDPTLFAVATPRALTPQQMAASLQFATTGSETFKPEAPTEEREKLTERLEKEGSSWTKLFERPGDDFQVGVDEALLFSNGEKVYKELFGEGKNRVIKSLLALSDSEQRVQAATWQALSRAPETAETDLLKRFLEERADRPTDAVQHLVWALISSAEFRFNH